MSGSHGTSSTNWKPGSVGSNFTHRISDRASTIRLVHSAVQRALEATVASSPRTDMITTPPTSGSQVISERIGKPAAFMCASILLGHRNNRKMLTSATTPISIEKA